MAERRVVFHYPKTLIDQPIVSGLVRDFGITVNILRANITPEQAGLMVVGLEGSADAIEAGLEWVKKQGVRAQALALDVEYDENRCTQCGHCVVVCPTGALHIQDRKSQRVAFDSDRCIACELCVPACPPRAMRVRF
jgi:ferredoxin